MNNSPYLSNILLLVLALFVFWKLRSVLGKNSTNQTSSAESSHSPLSKKTTHKKKELSLQEKKDDDVQQIQDLSSDELFEEAFKKGLIRDGLLSAFEPIYKKNKNITPQFLVHQAQILYEKVLEAFCGEDLSFLKKNLTSHVFSSFEKTIHDRNAKEEKLFRTLVGIDKTLIEDLKLAEDTISMKISFTTHMTSVIKNKENKIIQGDPTKIRVAHDVWTVSVPFDNKAHWIVTKTA